MSEIQTFLKSHLLCVLFSDTFFKCLKYGHLFRFQTHLEKLCEKLNFWKTEHLENWTFIKCLKSLLVWISVTYFSVECKIVK